MFDSTPAPFGEVTRRFTHLDDGRDRHLTRLPGDRCAGELPAHVEARRGVSSMEQPPSREHEATVVRRP
jgi:hypothetical protein